LGRQDLSHDVLILALKGLAGGSLVTAFALLSEGFAPKRFAGLFSAAPAVAIASLVIVLLDKGAHDAHQNTVGMLAGAAGMSVYAAAAVPLLSRMTAGRAALAALAAWFVTAGVVAVPVLLA
jgi:uncharacterized membrane protein (GlpM family)